MYFGIFVTLIVTLSFTAVTSLLASNPSSLSTEFKNTSFYKDFGLKYGGDLENTSNNGNYYTSVENQLGSSESNLGIGTDANSSITQGSSEWDLIFSGFSVVRNMQKLPSMLTDFVTTSSSAFGKDAGSGVSSIMSFLGRVIILLGSIFFIFELIKVLTGRDV